MPAAAAQRRTQAERSATTRARLLNAALDCLAELGYAGTTTIVVAERAGVSRGAQLHHFPTRAALVAAAVEHLYGQLTSEYQAGFAALEPGAERVGAAVDLLWSSYTSPHYAAALELFTAARTDLELRAHVQPIAARHGANVYRLAREYFPAADRLGARFDTTLAMILDAMQGMATSRLVRDGGPSEADRLAFLRAAAVRALAEAGLDKE